MKDLTITSAIDNWEVGPECVRDDFDAVVYKEGCVYSATYGGVDYFFYEDITYW